MSNIAKQQKKSVNALLHAEFKRIKKLALSALERGVQPAASGMCLMMKYDLHELFLGDLSDSSPRCRAFGAWPKSSGDADYPILLRDVKGVSNEHAAMHEYVNSIGMRWKGKYLEARLDLLDHLIEYFKPPVLPRTALLKLLRVDMQAEGYNHSDGICGAVDDAFGVEKVHSVVWVSMHALSPRNPAYPVPFGTRSNGQTHFDKHHVAGTMWVGEYGAARKAYALKLADYIAEHYTVHLNPVKQESSVQKIFKKVIAAGYYSFAGSPKASIFMCFALVRAVRGGVITHRERVLALSELKEYMKNPHKTDVMVNCLYYAGLLKSSNTKLSKTQRALIHLYKNWDKRPKLVY